MSIREIPAAAISDAVEALCIEANTRLPADVKAALDAAEAAEPWPLAKETLGLLQQNLCVAKEKDLPICQDTGMACVFLEIGQEVHVTGDLNAAVHEGVRQGYRDGYLRKSVVKDPLRRVNTGDNTLTYQGQRVSLTKNEYRILLCLMQSKGRVVSREKLMERLWETDSFVDENTLTVNIGRLRKKLDAAGLPGFITTRVGLGYMVG